MSPRKHGHERRPSPAVLAPLVACLAGLVLATEAAAVDGEPIFRSDFDSGALCAWSSVVAGPPPCTLDGVLGDLDDASNVEDDQQALKRASELAAPLLADFDAFFEAGATLFEVYADAKGAAFTVGTLHQAVVALDASAPPLGDALAALATDVAAAYASPTATGSALVVLMFSDAPGEAPPASITSETRLTWLGSVLYAEWLARAFPERAADRGSLLTCEQEVALNRATSKTRVLGQNGLVIAGKLALTFVNVVQIGSGSCLNFVADAVLDVAYDCFFDTFLDAFLLSGDPCFIAQNPEPVFGVIESCLIEAVPCIGDLVSAVVNGTQVVLAVGETLNAACTIDERHAPLLDPGCPDTQARCDACGDSGVDLVVERSCGLFDCPDPLNTLPELGCDIASARECVAANPVIPANALIFNGRLGALSCDPRNRDGDPLADVPDFDIFWSSDQPEIVEVQPPVRGDEPPAATGRTIVVRGRGEGVTTVSSTIDNGARVVEGTTVVEVKDCLEGTWSDDDGQVWELTQVGGTVTGTYLNLAMVVCPEPVFSVIGSFNDPNFSLTAIAPPNEDCCSFRCDGSVPSCQSGGGNCVQLGGPGKSCGGSGGFSFSRAVRAGDASAGRSHADPGTARRPE